MQFRTVLPSRGDSSLPWRASLSDWSSLPSGPACVGRTTPATCYVLNSSPGTNTASTANGKMRVCSLGLVRLGFRVRDKVRVSVRDRVGVRVSTFYFLSH